MRCPATHAITILCLCVACTAPPDRDAARRDTRLASAPAGSPASASPEALLFENACGICHGPDGRGRDGQAPALRDSPFIAGEPGVLIRIVLDGVRSDEAEREALYALPMPGWRVLGDGEIAAIVSHVRVAWHGVASGVAAADVARVRDATAGRGRPWTREELLPLLGTGERP